MGISEVFWGFCSLFLWLAVMTGILYNVIVTCQLDDEGFTDPERSAIDVDATSGLPAGAAPLASPLGVNWTERGGNAHQRRIRTRCAQRQRGASRITSA